MDKIELFETINIRWKEFNYFSEDNWINLAKLGYEKYREFDVPFGKWQIFVLKKDISTGSSKDTQPIQLFFAVFSSKKLKKQFPISGIAENLEEVISGLRMLSSLMSTEESKGLGNLLKFPSTLNAENAQDYGYIRGLLIGIVLMLVDIIPWHIGSFRPNGVLSTFLEYTRIVYYGTPGFAIVVGMAAIGIYFTVLFILIPIACGNFYLLKSQKAFRRRVEMLPDFLFECEFGSDAEAFLNQQYKSYIENIKKEEVYRRSLSHWRNLKKEEFIDLYEILQNGFYTAENLYDILCRIKRNCPDFDIKKFLEIMIDVSKKDMQIIMKVSSKDTLS